MSNQTSAGAEAAAAAAEKERVRAIVQGAINDQTRRCEALCARYKRVRETLGTEIDRGHYEYDRVLQDLHRACQLVAEKLYARPPRAASEQDMSEFESRILGWEGAGAPEAREAMKRQAAAQAQWKAEAAQLAPEQALHLIETALGTPLRLKGDRIIACRELDGTLLFALVAHRPVILRILTERLREFEY
jgi:hypothetical protein